jgi:2-iminobutanoate/2-iminopropanoate deaminase
MKFYPSVPTLETIVEVNNLSMGTAVEVGDLILLSGFVYLDAATGASRPDAPFEESARGTLELIEGVISDLGLSLDNVIKVTAYLTSAEHFPAWNVVFNESFSHPRPLRTTLVSGLVGGSIELEVIAARATRAESVRASENK